MTTSDRSSRVERSSRPERTSRPPERSSRPAERSSRPSEPEDKPKRFTGFARLPREERIEMARKGGKAAQQSPDARRWNSETASEAGRLGGLAVHERQRKTVSAESSR
jgi:general stress protein YciG